MQKQQMNKRQNLEVRLLKVTKDEFISCLFHDDFISCQRPHVISRALARRGPGTRFVKDKMQII